jgi:D-isomer specific 2-hydroxyacid dehydrogenase, catalytic domain
MSPKPEVFVVQPVMDVGREALEEIAEVDVFDSYRMISRPKLLNGVRDCDYLWMLGDTPIDEEVMEAAPKLKGMATMALFSQRRRCRSGHASGPSGHRGTPRHHQDHVRSDLRAGAGAGLAARRGRPLRPERSVPPGAVHGVPHARAGRQGRRDDRPRRHRHRDREATPGVREGRHLHEALPACRKRPSERSGSPGSRTATPCSAGPISWSSWPRTRPRRTR